MKISEIMSLEPEVIAPDAKLSKVAALMKSLDVGMIPVCDGDKLRGMVTDRDIVLRGVAEGRDTRELTASDVMTPEVIYCFEDQSVDEASELMERNQIRRLVVLNRDKRLSGILSLGDIAYKGTDTAHAGETLREVSEPAGAGIR
jgi:CBS domain-containing protein